MRDLHIFTNSISISELKELNLMISNPDLSSCKIRIMPNVFAEPTCISGFTSTLGKKIMPKLLGNDIGCGVLVTDLGNIDIDINKLDDIIKKFIPYGRNIHKTRVTEFFKYDEPIEDETQKPYSRFERCLGTLGGGEHFIELDEDTEKNKYLIIHSGSRGYGMKVSVVHKYNEELPEAISRKLFFEDLDICLSFAAENRRQIARIILEKMDIKAISSFDVFHNSIERNIIRKGAVSAKKGEKLIITLNEKDGCLLGVGKGNPDWNMSAPSSARKIIDGDIDYETPEATIKAIEATADIQKILKPIYNFKVRE